MLLVIFGIIDLSWYIYGYSTIYMGSRNGAEKASEIPPMPNRVGPALDANDQCVYNILLEVQKNAVFFPDLTSHNPSYVTISYPEGRGLGKQVEVNVSYTVEPLTPLWNLVSFGQQGRIPISVTTRRTIESLGNNPNSPNLVACN